MIHGWPRPFEIDPRLPDDDPWDELLEPTAPGESIPLLVENLRTLVDTFAEREGVIESRDRAAWEADGPCRLAERAARRRAVRLFRRGASFQALAAKFGCSVSHAYNTVHALGVTRRRGRVHMQIELFVMDACDACEAAKTLLREAGAEYVELHLEHIDEYDDRDDAQAQLALQGMAAPLIRVGGTWTDIAGLRQALGLGAEATA